MKLEITILYKYNAFSKKNKTHNKIGANGWCERCECSKGRGPGTPDHPDHRQDEVIGDIKMANNALEEGTDNQYRWETGYEKVGLMDVFFIEGFIFIFAQGSKQKPFGYVFCA